MRFYIALLLTLFISTSAYQNELDSLLKRMESISDPVEKSTLLNDICLRLVYSDPDSAMQFGLQALDLGKKLNNQTIQAKALNRIGIVFDVINQWDSALIYYDSALYFAELAPDSITIASAYNNIGLVYWNKSELDKASSNFFKSLKLFELLGKKIGVANTYNNIGLIFMEQERPLESINYHFQALKVREEIDDDYGIHDSKLNIALMYYALDNYDSSMFYFREVIPYFEASDNHYALGTAYNNYALTFDSLKMNDSALIYYDKAVAEHLAVQNNYKVASTFLNKSAIYRRIRDYDKEFQTLLKAQSYIEDEGSDRVKMKVLFNLAQNYFVRGKYRKSSELFLEYKVLADTFYLIDRDEMIEDIKVKYETEKKEKELLREKAENERLAKEKALAEIKVYNRNKWIIGISSLSLILILSGLAMNQRKRRKEQAEKDAAVIEEREKGIRAVFEAQEEERQRIAKDLHDGVGQQVSAVKIQLHGLKDSMNSILPDAIPEFESIEKMMADTGEDIRNISHQMMPRALTELGLIAAMEDMLEKSFRYHKIKYSFDQHGIAQRLPSHVEIGLYRIAQELVNNIIKHAEAGSVDVQLMKTQSHCLLIVQDDGKGIEPETKVEGIGMLNISNRLRTLNGELSMESATGQGTTATIRIAL